jgi:HK97 family phage prohead protease
MNIEYKTHEVVCKNADDTTGIAEMIVSVFGNVDDGGDKILPGFFAESLAKRRNAAGQPKVKGVWAHDWSMPIAKTLEARELQPGDPMLPAILTALGGLYIKGQFNLETQRGKEAFSDLKFGTIDEFSIGYYTQEFQRDNDTGVRTLIKGELYEWSPVLVGMNDETMLLSVKSNKPLEVEIKTILTATDSLGERLRSLKGMRNEEGRDLSEKRIGEIKDLVEKLRASADALEAAAEPEPDLKKQALAEYARSIEIEASLGGMQKG